MVHIGRHAHLHSIHRLSEIAYELLQVYSRLEILLLLDELLLDAVVTLAFCPFTREDLASTILLCEFLGKADQVATLEERLIVDVKNAIKAHLLISLNAGDKLILASRELLAHEFAEQLALVQLLFSFLLRSVLLRRVDLSRVEALRNAIKRMHAISFRLEVVLKPRHLWPQLIYIGSEGGFVVACGPIHGLLVPVGHLAVPGVDIIVILIVQGCPLTVLDEVVEHATRGVRLGEVISILVQAFRVLLEPGAAVALLSLPLELLVHGGPPLLLHQQIEFVLH